MERRKTSNIRNRTKVPSTPEALLKTFQAGSRVPRSLRCVTKETAQRFAEREGMLYAETSTKGCYNAGSALEAFHSPWDVSRPL